MLVSLTSANFGLLDAFMAITFIFFGVSIFVCLLIVLRRIRRNNIAAWREKQKADFQNHLINLLKEDTLNFRGLETAPDCRVAEIASVFLHYFRTLKGKNFEYLQDLISGSAMEDKLIKSTFNGIRGVRMRSLRTLSYLDSQKSLQVIFENLSSEDKYVRLTAARCLVRRGSLCYLPAIIDCLNESFPQDFKIIADVIAGFGADSVKTLEHYIVRTDNDNIKASCLEALILIMPAQTSVNFEKLMKDKSASVRAAALSFSEVTSHNQAVDPLVLGLRDKAVSVKIRAAKLACTIKRTDITADLYKLANDPVMWVRYWALRAIWMSGLSGQKFVESLSRSNIMAGNVALELCLNGFIIFRVTLTSRVLFFG